jgi:hypothetical protein
MAVVGGARVELWREGRLDASRTSGPAPYANPSMVGSAVWGIVACTQKKERRHVRKGSKCMQLGTFDSEVFFFIHCSLRDLSLLGHPHPCWDNLTTMTTYILSLTLPAAISVLIPIVAGGFVG